MRLRSLISLILALVCLPLGAQQMSVEDFVRLKGVKVEKDKAMAILDLMTDQTGFTVLCNGNKPADVQEGDGFIRVLLPHKTTRLSIQHPVFGQLAWAAPKKLKKNRHYQALLFAIDPTATFQPDHQWVVFHLHPSNAVVQIDTVAKPVRSSIVEYYLPIGEHSYKVEAPFFEASEGRFTLTDQHRTDLTVELQPFYSYITVKTDWKGGDLYIDGVGIRGNEATSLRLDQGHHRVAYFWGKECYYDSLLYVGPSQKIVLNLTQEALRRLPQKKDDSWSMMPRPYGDTSGVAVAPVPVKLACKDPEAQIIVDREVVGKGQWEGNLSLGYHLLGTRKDGKEGTAVNVLFEDSFPQEIELMVPGSAYGLVNVRCNVPDARILIDGEDQGTTPRLLQLDASRSYQLTVYKAGYKEKKTRIQPKGNGQIEVQLKLKKR